MRRCEDTKRPQGWVAAAVVSGFIALGSAAPACAQSAPETLAPRVSVAPKAMKTIAPALADYTDEVLFGDVWRRPELSPRDRSVVTLSALIATGKSAPLAGHLGRALDNGVKPGEIAGIVTHLAFYAGWPNAVSALDVIEKVFAERKIEMAVNAQPSALRPAPDANPAWAPAFDAPVEPLAPKLAELTNDILRADLWRRSDLAPRDRSLVTIVALAANGDDDELAAHISRGLANGLTRAEIAEALTHLAFYAGWPKATAAVAAASQVFAGAGDDLGVAYRPLQIFPPGQSPVNAAASHFTGSATVTSPFKATGTALGGATVTFQPGARTHWHSHPQGQWLIVIKGAGWIQVEGEPVRLIKAGDVVWTAPGVKHWHGATRTSSMKHVAIAESGEGKTVTWFEPVSEKDYHGPSAGDER